MEVREMSHGLAVGKENGAADLRQSWLPESSVSSSDVLSSVKGVSVTVVHAVKSRGITSACNPQSNNNGQVSSSQIYQSYTDVVPKQVSAERRNSFVKVVPRRPVGTVFSLVSPAKREHKPRQCLTSRSDLCDPHLSNANAESIFREISSKSRRSSARNRFLFSLMEAKRPLSDLSNPSSFHTIEKVTLRKPNTPVSSYTLVHRAVCPGLAVASPFETRTNLLGVSSQCSRVPESCDPSFACSDLSVFLDKHSDVSVHFCLAGDDIVSTVRQTNQAAIDNPVNKDPVQQKRTHTGPHFKTLLERNFHFGLVDPKVYSGRVSSVKQPSPAIYHHVSARHLRVMCRSKLSTGIPLRFSVERASRLIPLRAALHPSKSERRSWDRQSCRGSIYYTYSDNKQVYLNNSRLWSNCRIAGDAFVEPTHAITVPTSSDNGRLSADVLSESYLQTVVIDRYRATVAVSALAVRPDSSSSTKKYDSKSMHRPKTTRIQFNRGRCKNSSVKYVGSACKRRLVDRILKRMEVLKYRSSDSECCSRVASESCSAAASESCSAAASESCSAAASESCSAAASELVSPSLDGAGIFSSDGHVLASSSRPSPGHYCSELNTGGSPEHSSSFISQFQSDVDYFDSVFESSDDEMCSDSEINSSILPEDSRASLVESCSKSEKSTPSKANSFQAPHESCSRGERSTLNVQSPHEGLCSNDGRSTSDVQNDSPVAPMKWNAGVCDKSHCKLGCVCQSLLCNRVVTHCGKVQCMLNCVCMYSGNSEHRSMGLVHKRMTLLRRSSQDTDGSAQTERRLSGNGTFHAEVEAEKLTVSCLGREPKVELFRLRVSNADPFCIFHESANCEIYRSRGDCYITRGGREICQRGRNIAKLYTPKCSRHIPVCRKTPRKLAKESYDLDKQCVVVGNFPKNVLKLLLAANLGRLWLKVPVHVNFVDIERIVMLYQQDEREVIVSVQFGYRLRQGGVWLLSSLVPDGSWPWRIADADGAVLYNDNGHVFRNAADQSADVDVVSQYRVMQFSLPAVNWLVKRGILYVSPIEQRSLTPHLRTSGQTSVSSLSLSRVDRRTRKLCPLGTVIIGFSPNCPQLSIIGSVNGQVSTCVSAMDEFSSWSKSCGLNIDHYITGMITEVTRLRKPESSLVLPAGSMDASAPLVNNSPPLEQGHAATAQVPSVGEGQVRDSTDHVYHSASAVNCENKDEARIPRRRLKVVVSGLNCDQKESQSSADDRALTGCSPGGWTNRFGSHLLSKSSIRPGQMLSSSRNRLKANAAIRSAADLQAPAQAACSSPKSAVDKKGNSADVSASLVVADSSCNVAEGSAADLTQKTDSVILSPSCYQQTTVNRKRIGTFERDIRSQTIQSGIPGKMLRMEQVQGCQSFTVDEVSSPSIQAVSDSGGTRTDTDGSLSSQLKKPFLSSVNSRPNQVHSSKVEINLNGSKCEFRRVEIKSMPDIMYVEGIPVFLTRRYVDYVISQIKKVCNPISVKMGGFRLTVIWAASAPDVFLVGPVTSCPSDRLLGGRASSYPAVPLHAAREGGTLTTPASAVEQKTDTSRLGRAGCQGDTGAVELVDLDSTGESSDECVIVAEKPGNECDSGPNIPSKKVQSQISSSACDGRTARKSSPPPSRASVTGRRDFSAALQHLVHVLGESTSDGARKPSGHYIADATSELVRLKRRLKSLEKRRHSVTKRQNRLIRMLNDRIHAFPLESRIERAAEVEENLPFIQVQMADNPPSGEPTMCLVKKHDHFESSQLSTGHENDPSSPTIFTECRSDDVQLQLI